MHEHNCKTMNTASQTAVANILLPCIYKLYKIGRNVAISEVKKIWSSEPDNQQTKLNFIKLLTWNSANGVLQ